MVLSELDSRLPLPVPDAALRAASPFWATGDLVKLLDPLTRPEIPARSAIDESATTSHNTIKAIVARFLRLSGSGAHEPVRVRVPADHQAEDVRAVVSTDRWLPKCSSNHHEFARVSPQPSAPMCAYGAAADGTSRQAEAA